MNKHSLNESNFLKCVSKVIILRWVNVGEKINTRELFIREESWSNTIIRTIRSDEDRYQTLEFIEELMESVIQMYLYYVEATSDLNQSLAKMLMENLNKCRPGLDNLCVTYKYDRMFISKMGAVLALVDAKIGTIVISNSDEDNDDSWVKHLIFI